MQKASFAETAGSVLIDSAKLNKKTLNKIVELLPPNEQETLKSVIRKVLFTRKVITLISVLEITISRTLFHIAIVKNSSRLLLISILLEIILDSSWSYIANYLQDFFYYYREFFQNIFCQYILDSKDTDLELKASIKTLSKELQKSFTLERYGNIGLKLLAFLVTTYYIATVYMGINASLLLIILTISVGVSFVFIHKMQSLYSQYGIDEPKLKSRLDNRLDQGSYLPVLKDHYERGKKLLNKIQFSKMVLNTYNQFYLLAAIAILFNQNSSVMVTYTIILISFLSSIDSSILSSIRLMPSALSVQRDILYPAITSLQEIIPSPLSITSDQVFQTLPKIKSIKIRDLSLKPNDIDRNILTIDAATIPIKKGLYLVTGDSGEGKSVFMNLVANNRFQTRGEISLIDTDQTEWDYSKLGYWAYRKIIKYVWITNERFNDTTVREIYQGIIDTDYGSEFLKDFIDQGNAIEDLLLGTNLFRENEKHILDADVGKLSGGQQARAYTAMHMVTAPQILLIDESLERTTKNFSDSEILTRERLVDFIAYITERSDKTIFLLIQGGIEEEKMIKSKLNDNYLGKLHFEKSRLMPTFV